jgi:diguanylate cyclase (GGDEF)-like protein
VTERRRSASWPLWTLSRPALLYVLATDVAAFLALAVALAWGPPLVALAVLPAIVLHRAVFVGHLVRAARTDGKTGVLNGTAWTQRARMELARSRRTGRSMAVLMIDLDGFKQVNDEHGHLAGDVVLHRVAQALAAQVRRTDVVGRVGGDEFAVLLPATGAPEALIVAERIRQDVRRVQTPVATALSSSIGVAVHPYAAEGTVEGLLAAADAALYQAKDSGRDLVRLAGANSAPDGRRALPAGQERATPAGRERPNSAGQEPPRLAGHERPAPARERAPDVVSAGRRRR